MPVMLQTTLLLICSNVFMTFAWYAHLKDMSGRPWFIAALVSWGVALAEYLLQVPANRIGYTTMNLGQLKILQEVIALSVFVPFAVLSMKQPLKLNYLWAAMCICAAVYFVFQDSPKSATEHAAAARPSRHAAPPADFAALNTATLRRVPESLAGVVLPDDRPAVVVFLKAACGCSEDFARMLAALAPQFASRASCLAVVEAQDGEAELFLESTGLTAPHVIQSDGSLAAAWGVTKAGCVALVRPDGSVEAVWPGISRQGFRDLATRLGDANLFPAESLAVLPGPATAGCPLLSASLAPSPGIAR